MGATYTGGVGFGVVINHHFIQGSSDGVFRGRTWIAPRASAKPIYKILPTNFLQTSENPLFQYQNSFSDQLPVLEDERRELPEVVITEHHRKLLDSGKTTNTNNKENEDTKDNMSRLKVYEGKRVPESNSGIPFRCASQALELFLPIVSTDSEITGNVGWMTESGMRCTVVPTYQLPNHWNPMNRNYGTISGVTVGPGYYYMTFSIFSSPTFPTALLAFSYMVETPPGSAVSELSSELRICEHGTYKELSDASYCQVCPVGTYTKSSYATSCSPCPNTTFCPAGSWLPLPLELLNDSYSNSVDFSFTATNGLQVESFLLTIGLTRILTIPSLILSFD